MSDNFFFNSGFWDCALRATDRVHCCSNMLPLTLLFVVSDPNPVTAEQNYFSGLCHAKFVPAAKFVPGASSIRNPLQICLATDDRFVRCLATDDRVEQ